MDKTEFAITALDKNTKTLVVHVTAWSTPATQVHPSRQALFRLLLANKCSIEIPSEYLDYADVFLFDFVIELPENTDINKHAMELVEDKQPSCGPIYSQGPVKLESLKTYLEKYLKIGFIQLFKSLADALILFNQKLDGRLCLWVNY